VLHWRRTFFAGALALVADVAILLVDPLRAINTWYLVAVVGLAMIALVIFVERQRQRIPVWLGEWRQRLETWD
jgi:preprotein translocase subunit SecY